MGGQRPARLRRESAIACDLADGLVGDDLLEAVKSIQRKNRCVRNRHVVARAEVAIVVNTTICRATTFGELNGIGPNPTDRRKLGSKHHILVDGQGIPLAAMTTGANRHDSQGLMPLLGLLKLVRGRPGRPRRFPKEILGDRAYDSKKLREACRDRGMRPRLAKRNTPHGSGLGKFRWPVERTISWLHRFRRLGYHRDRLLPIHDAFLALGCALIACRFL